MTILVHDRLGREIARPVDDLLMEAGAQRVIVGAGLASGAWFVTISVDGERRTVGVVKL